MSRIYKDAFDRYVKEFTLSCVQPVFYWICDLAGDDGLAYPLPEQLARLCDCGWEWIDEYAAPELERLGLIKYTPKDNLTGTPVFQILMQPDRPTETTQRIVVDININVKGGAS